jgi:hypothetical protein
MSRTVFCGLVLSALGGLSSVHADSIQLVNGDVIRGDVKSLDGRHVVLTSEILGELRIDRTKLQAIHFGEGRPAFAPLNGQGQPALDAQAQTAGEPPAAPGKIPAPGTPASTPEELFEKLTGRSVPRAGNDGQSVEDVIRQLQSGGLGGDVMKDVQGAFPLLAVPEVQQHFQSNLKGLMTGQLSIQDIRKQAIEARDSLLELKEDLGPNGAALNGYLTILEGFINETQPLEERPPSASPNSAGRRSGRQPSGRAT